MKVEFSRQVFEKKSSNIKLHENPSRWSRVVACRRTDAAKLIVAVRSFSNAPSDLSKILVNGLEPSAPPAEQSRVEQSRASRHSHCSYLDPDVRRACEKTR